MYGSSKINWKQINQNYPDYDVNKYLRIRFEKVRYTQDDLKPLLALIKKANRKKEYISRSSSGSSRMYNSNSFINSSKQQVTVKFRYSDSLQAHAKYLNNYMIQKDKKEIDKKPELFGNVSREEYIRRMAKETKTVYKNGKAKKKKYSRHYKWILSPEMNLDGAVLKEYTKCFIQRLEQVTGYKFVWQAAVHTNTAHNHVHVLINGVDMYGRKIKKFSKDIIKNYARAFSQDILTNICGARDVELKRKARENRCYAERWTEFDEVLAKACSYDENYKKYLGVIGKVSDVELRTRLDYLQSINLCDVINGKYYLKKDFEKKLKTFGRYNTFRDAQNYVHNGDDLKLYTKEMGEIMGTIRKVYTMNDEDVWNNGVVLEDEETGESYYVPSFNPVNRKVGDKIKVVYETKAGGRTELNLKSVQPDIKNNVEPDNDYDYED